MSKKVKEVIKSKCPNCGSDMYFDPEKQCLVCKHCESEQLIQKKDEVIEEYDYSEYSNKVAKDHEGIKDPIIFNCEECGGQIVADPKAISLSCPFCGSNKVIKHDEKAQVIEIEGVIPFKLPSDEVVECFRKWIKSKLLAPRPFKNGKQTPSYRGFYIPFMTFDANTNSSFTAMRGDYYYVTRTRTVNGKTQTYSERRVRWTPVSGTNSHIFDDLIVRGTSNILDEYIDKIKDYDLKELVKYQEDYLFGYYTEMPSISLQDGFVSAKTTMNKVIAEQIRKQVGGDTISNLSVKTQYSNIKFKQILCPIYNGTYKYNNKVYHFLINAQTSKFSGKYPYSKIKISILVVLLLIVIALAVYLFVTY